MDLLTLGPGQPPFLSWLQDGGDNGPDEDVCKKERSNPDEYGQKVCEIAVAQICEGVGFEEVKKYTLVALSQMVVKYISDLAKSATFNAHLAGRSQANVFDVLKGLEDLGGCSTSITHNNSESIANQMSEFVEEMEIPFANPIPRFPVISRGGITQGPSFLQMGEAPGSKHIPDWLPAFPDPHTYLNTPLWNQRKLDLRIDKGEQARQRRKAERSLLNLQQRLLSNALAGTSASGAHSGPYIANHHVQSLALPSTKGNKDVIENSDHPRKHVLVRHMFAPVVEALKGDGTNGVSDSEAVDIDRRVTPISISVSNKRRPVVNFKLKAGKKMLVEDMDVHLRSRVIEKRTSLLGRDEDKDDKKRRAEFILRQSIDNQKQM